MSDILTLVKQAEAGRAFAAQPIARRPLIDLVIPVSTVGTNFFLPYHATWATNGVTVNVEWSKDGFSTIYTSFAFYMQDFAYQVIGGQDWIYPRSTFNWHARFSPPTSGNWQYRVKVTDSGGTTTSSVVAYTIPSFSAPGRIQAAASDTRYFEYQDGTPWHPVGWNLTYQMLTWDDPVSVNRSRLATMAAAGVNWARYWVSDFGIWGSEVAAWTSNHALNHQAYVSTATYDVGATYTPYSGSETARYVAAGYSSSFLGWPNRSPACKRSTTYRMRVRYQTPTLLTKASGGSSSFGLVGKISTVFPDAPGGTNDPEKSSYGTVVTTYATAATTTSWAEISGTFTTRSTQDFLDYIFLTLEHCDTSNGLNQAYVDSVWIEEDLGGGTYGPNLVAQAWQTPHHTVDQRQSFALDLLVQELETAGVSIQAQMLGSKQDWALTLMADAGTLGALATRSESNFWGPTSGRQRYLHSAVGRYFHGRWGYSSAIQAWELCNEGGSIQRHIDAANDWIATIAATNDRPMLGTSTQINEQQQTFWNGVNSDWTDVHLYRDVADTGFNTIRVDHNSTPETITVSAITDFQDTAQGVLSLSAQIGAKKAYGTNKPTVRGETGLVEGGSTDSFTAQLDADTAGVWLKKYLWAQLNDGGVLDSYWYSRQHIYDVFDGTPNHLDMVAPYAAFVATLPLNNGHYVDAAATCSDSTHLAAIGQKDLTNKAAHLWIRNKAHTWKAVVDGTSITAGTGTVSLPSMPSGTYAAAWINTSTGATIQTDSVTSNGTTMSLTLPSSTSTDVAVNITLSDTGDPAVPITFRTSSHAENPGGSSNSHDITAPASIALNDLLILFVMTGNLTITPPSGFTSCGTGVVTGGVKLQAFYKVASGSEPGTYTVGLSGSSYTDLIMLRYDGEDSSGAFNAYQSSTSSSTTSHAATGITTAHDGALVLAAYSNISASLGATTPPSGFTERIKTDNATVINELIQTSAGATGTLTETTVDTASLDMIVVSFNAPSAPTAPGLPQNVVGTPSSTQIAATWDAPASNGGSSITSYTVSLSGGSNPSFTTPDGSTVSHTFTGLTNGTPYTPSAVATNAIGTGSAGTGSAVTPSVFSPTSITGLVGWYKADAGVYSDAGTTPAVDAGTIQQWSDQSGAGNHLSQATGESRPTYQAPHLGDIGAVSFPGSKFMANSGFSAVNGATALTLVYVLELLGDGILVSTNTGSNGLETYYQAAANNLYDFFSARAIDGIQVGHPTWIQEVVYDGSQATNATKLKHFSSGRQLTLSFDGTIPTALPATNGLTIGRSSDGTTSATVKVRELLIYTGALNSTDRGNLRTYLRARHAQGTRKYVTCAGDSLTAGVGGTAYPTQLAALLGTDYLVGNMGVQGSTLQTEWSAWDSQIMYPATGHPRDIEACWLGTNDIASGRTAAQVFADLSTRWAARRADGYKVIACTIIARGTLTGGQETQRQGLDTLIRGAGSQYDALCDLAADARLSDSADTTYYSGDTTHLTTTGYGVVAGLVQTAALAVPAASSHYSGRLNLGIGIGP